MIAYKKLASFREMQCPDYAPYMHSDGLCYPEEEEELVENNLGEEGVIENNYSNFGENVQNNFGENVQNNFGENVQNNLNYGYNMEGGARRRRSTRKSGRKGTRKSRQNARQNVAARKNRQNTMRKNRRNGRKDRR